MRFLRQQVDESNCIPLSPLSCFALWTLHANSRSLCRSQSLDFTNLDALKWIGLICLGLHGNPADENEAAFSIKLAWSGAMLG
jgi:hypothetical protein